jgi:hypothetical protein
MLCWQVEQLPAIRDCYLVVNVLGVYRVTVGSAAESNLEAA